MSEQGSDEAERDGRRPASRMDALFRAAFMAALAVLVFTAGAFLAVAGYFPGPQITRAYEGGRALYARMTQFDDVYGTDLWYPQRSARKGVTVNRAGRVQDGVTLYTSGSAPAAFLIDAEGRVLHTWRKPYSAAWAPGSGGVREPQPDSHVYFRQAHVFPNGDLLALYEGVGDTPYGYGLVKLDRDGAVLWRYPGRAHHQFDIGPDGRIYALTHAFVEDELDGFAHLDKPRLEDFLVVLSPDGEELRKIRLLEALGKSEFRQMIYTVAGFALDDPTHANTVEYIDADKAAAFAFGAPGEVLLSLRSIHALIVLDPETGRIGWGTRGPWIGQHDPDILPDGDILMFDNFGNYDRPNGVSRVIQFDPVTMEIVWQYAGTAQDPLDSHIRSDQQRLANGNTLITESNGGRLVEVDSRGAIVWEFVNPVRAGPDGDLIPIIAWAERLDPADFDPSFLKPQPQQAGMRMKKPQMEKLP